MIKTLIQFPNGGKIDVYKFVDRLSNDYNNVFKCCEHFALQGAHTIIYPQFSVTVGNIAYEYIFASLKNTPFWGRCPDFTVNGVWYEHEGYEPSKDLTDPKKMKLTFSNMLARGLKQSDRIIVEDCHFSRFFAKRSIYKRINFEHQNISEIYIRTDAGLELLYKKEEG